jgi:hypothetical protein
MGDQNLWVLEVRNATILYLNEHVPIADGWYWGPDNRFIDGPFESYELAVAHARQHSQQELKLLVFDKKKFDGPATKDPPARGCIVVIDTSGHLWTRKTEAPASDGWVRGH